MKLTVDIPEEAFDKLIVDDLTKCYWWALDSEDQHTADCVKTLLYVYYLSPAKYKEWLEEVE